MQAIEGILFEPVGSLAEFPAEPFHEIAHHLFGGRKKTSKSASRAYWHLLNLLEASDQHREIPEELELIAVAGAQLYEDVLPALAELKRMGVTLLLTSSLSRAAIRCFLERFSLSAFFAEVWTRDCAGGIKAAPLERAVEASCLDPQATIFLTDTAEGLKAAASARVAPVLMMNDPDEAKRLAMHEPAGGIVSLHELPDFVRLVAARA
ncbi:MAG: HAD family hydrolase [Acidobacteriia bacterium]|nr:HAD family hydrolase [Terriglobia bacterium]